jgi:carbon starvation protein CstA
MREDEPDERGLPPDDRAPDDRIDARARRDADPTHVRSQSQLTSATGGTWVLVGSVVAAVVVVMLVALAADSPSGLAGVGIAAEVALVLGLVAARFGLRAGRARLAVLAVLTLAIGVTGLVCLAAIGADAWPT